MGRGQEAPCRLGRGPASGSFKRPRTTSRSHSSGTNPSGQPGLGAEFVAAVDVTLELVLRFPESCELFYRETRRCLIERFPFEVFYRFDGELIIVVACMHGARDPQAILKRIGG